MHFPLFMDLSNRLIVVFGGGQIATRRIQTLLRFSCKIRLIAPQISEELQVSVQSGCIEYICACYDSKFLSGAFIAIGATNDRAVNHQVYLDATHAKLLVNIIDSKQECSFFFPAVFEDSQIVGGLISKAGHNHALVKTTAQQIRHLLDGGK